MKRNNYISAVLLHLAFIVFGYSFSSSLFAQVKVVSNSSDTARNLKLLTQKAVPRQLLSPISLELKNVPLGKALREIADKGEFELLFSDTFIPTGRIVSVSLDNETVAEALNQVLAQTATEYAVTKAGQVVLVPTKYTRGNLAMQPEPIPNVQIRGTVIDEETGSPMAGANVVIKGTTIGAAADRDGNFSIDFDAEEDFTLVVSFIGHKRYEQVYKPEDNLLSLRIALATDPFLFEELVVTGIAFQYLYTGIGSAPAGGGPFEVYR